MAVVAMLKTPEGRISVISHPIFLKFGNETEDNKSSQMKLRSGCLTPFSRTAAAAILENPLMLYLGHLSTECD
jgi:hypothetical protein